MIKIRQFLENRIFVLTAIFLFVFLAHTFSPIATSFDSKWSIYISESIIREGNTNLDEYQTALEREDNYAIETVSGHKYSIFPVGTSVMSVPFVFLADEFMKVFSKSHQVSSVDFSVEMEKIIASIFVATASVFIFLISEELIKKEGFFAKLKPKSFLYSLLLVFIFAFCTSVWSTASRALWMHGPTMLLLTIVLYIVLRAKEKPEIIQYVSIPLFFSYIIRPTNIVSIILFSVYIFWAYRKYFKNYLLWSLIIVLPFLAFNFATYNNYLAPYYSEGRLGFHKHFWEALAGNLISPNRGLFVFTPILIFSFVGIYIKIKRGAWEFLDWILVGVIFLHWIAVSLFPNWDGGACYGPRYMSDIIPYFVYFLLPAIAVIPSLGGGVKIIYLSVFILFLAISFFIHLRGAWDWDVYVWNSVPKNPRSKIERFWDMNDLQFLRGLNKA